MANKLRVAVIGAGNMGRNHIRTYKMLSGIELIALADINPAAKELADENGIKFYRDYQKMLDTEGLDAVSIVVPTPLHHPIGMDVLLRGINCLIEKPIASTPEQAHELIKTAKKSGVVFTVGHIEHYNPMIQKLKQLIIDKKIGKVTSVVCKRVGGFPAIEPKTDVIIDLAVHDVDIIGYLLNKRPKSMHSHGSRTHHSSKIDAAEILLDYGDASGFVQANWITPVKIRTIAVTGSKGYIEGDYITQQLVHYEHNMQRQKSKSDVLMVRLGAEPKRYAIPIKFKEPLSVELQHFTDRIRGKETELVDPLAAKEALKFALEAVRPYENTD